MKMYVFYYDNNDNDSNENKNIIIVRGIIINDVKKSK